MLNQGANVILMEVETKTSAGISDALQGFAAPLVVPLDVTDTQSWSSAVDKTVAKFGMLDIVVNNAGVVSSAPHAFDEIELDEWRRVFSVNVDGVVLGA